jgi:spore maturation protein CgeB
MPDSLQITILGLSITSSWGNGHATTYRSLARGLADRGHSVHFLERDVPWYSANRDLPDPPFAATSLYANLDELTSTHAARIRESDLVIVGSFVPDGIAVGRWVCSLCRGVSAFYDIDTPVTLDKLARGECDYLDTELISSYDCYLSFAGGPLLRRLERQFGAPLARPLYCCVDAERYSPQDTTPADDLGYLGTYSADRQPPLERLMLQPARHWPEGRFVVAGPQYPEDFDWPANVRRIEHLPPGEHGDFYGRQRFTLNLTREQMIRTGFAPSVRLFEAAACGVPVISDWWEGLDTFFRPDREILISRSSAQTLAYLRGIDDAVRQRIGSAARARVLSEHTAQRRAEELEGFFAEAAAKQSRKPLSRRRSSKAQHEPV